MTMSHSSVLEFPAMLHGLPATVLHEVKAQGQKWAQDFLQTGTFTPPDRMLSVATGSLLEMQSGAVFDGTPHARWRVHLLDDVFLHLHEGVPSQDRPLVWEAFESFCLNTPWGALFLAVAPYPPRSAKHTARRLGALLRDWETLENFRYAIWLAREDTLEELMRHIHRETLNAWCPGGPASMREHMALVVERMSRATREECVEAVLRVAPVLVAANTGLGHRAVLGDPDFLREQLAMLPPEDFEDLSGACKDPVSLQLSDWDRALGQ